MAKNKNTALSLSIKTEEEEFDFQVKQIAGKDYFSLTDILKGKEDGEQLIYSWMRNRNTVEYLGTWEKLNNPEFDLQAFGEFQQQAGLNNFTLSPKKWIEATKSIGIVSKSGRYGGGTYAHADIALEFCGYLSPVLRLYVNTEFQRLKEEENLRLAGEQDWNLKRLFSKINYHIHTDAVKNYLIPPRLLQEQQKGIIYATEADMLNVALFGISAKDWRLLNPDLKGNIRDFASTEQLLVLANLENLNAEYIHLGLSKDERLARLNEVAIYQMQLLLEMPNMKKALDKGK
jgi:KilA-N domain